MSFSYRLYLKVKPKPTPPNLLTQNLLQNLKDHCKVKSNINQEIKKYEMISENLLRGSTEATLEELAYTRSGDKVWK